MATQFPVSNTIQRDGDIQRHSAPSLEDDRVIDVQHFLGGLFQKINRKLTSGTDYESVLDFVFDSLDVVIPYDRMGIALIGEGGNHVRLRWVRSKVPIQSLKLGYSAQLSGSSLETIIQTGQPRIINDLVLHLNEHPQSGSTKLAVQDGVRSSFTCPLRANDKPIGLVFFSSCKPDTYRDQHIQTFLDIADELSVIVEQGRLKFFFEANKSNGKNLAMVLHDLRSPLGIIQGFIEASLSEDWYNKLNGDAKEIFSILGRNAKFMFGLLDDLTEIGELHRHEAPLARQKVNLIDFFNEVTTDVQLLARKKEIQIFSDIDPSLPESAMFEPGRIRQVLENLLTNAAKYSKRGSRIILTVRGSQDRITVSVSDQGQGIPENELSKLFCDFGKTSVRPTEGEQSTGLGLAIAKRIVERHGGKISVESAVNHGSIFKFWIPTS
ncbi:MAG: GAF domain-containing sensor histidine kinase [Bdellovibrionales bacterium]|nr:GAF domain-containing sensor histidine kinase [Bdellovibrionales bacterium]